MPDEMDSSDWVWRGFQNGKATRRKAGRGGESASAQGRAEDSRDRRSACFLEGPRDAPIRSSASPLRVARA
ncbi:hypothetical protein C0J50_7900 [Silurus asotus]|uniref:Uncharacterized protein n=1 Tax=Silurus asotus TaxID=30991 RepID=A0AAD5B6D0_SILAS|nr:hypothetical protein C0J50_7900 [Silurus asotus]